VLEDKRLHCASLYELAAQGLTSVHTMRGISLTANPTRLAAYPIVIGSGLPIRVRRMVGCGDRSCQNTWQPGQSRVTHVYKSTATRFPWWLAARGCGAHDRRLSDIGRASWILFIIGTQRLYEVMEMAMNSDFQVKHSCIRRHANKLVTRLIPQC